VTPRSAARSAIFSTLRPTATISSAVPPRVDYELTALGHSLRATLDALTAWAAIHMEDVIAARQAYDAG
jgi:DNA-binding HxlR family transcriptional regulator